MIDFDKFKKVKCDFDKYFKKAKREYERAYGVKNDPQIKLQTNITSIIQHVLADNKTISHLFSTDKDYARNFKDPFPIDLTNITIFYFTLALCKNKTKECIDGYTGEYFCRGGVIPISSNIPYNQSKFKTTVIDEEIHLSKCKYYDGGFLYDEKELDNFPEKIKEALIKTGYDVRMCERGVLDFSYMGEMYDTICICIG